MSSTELEREQHRADEAYFLRPRAVWCYLIAVQDFIPAKHRRNYHRLLWDLHRQGVDAKQPDTEFYLEGEFDDVS